MEVVRRYKYRQALWFEPFLADLLVRQAVPDLAREHWGCIVPVPLHPLRKREREFNQAERLAAHLAAASGIPLNGRLLRRVENTPTQTMLTRSERSANVRHAFAMRQGCRLPGGRLLLVDDVLTTGATTSACAQTLLAAGAEAVCVWTVVRAV
jgi:ComF family protein